jgi:hypothetical protein
MGESIVKGDLYAGQSLVTLNLHDNKTAAKFDCAFSVN